MTTLFPEMSLPSASAARTMAFAILSFTEPPADRNSTFPTIKKSNSSWYKSDDWRDVHTKVAFETLLTGKLIEADERGVPNGIECRIKYLRISLGMHVPAVGKSSEWDGCEPSLCKTDSPGARHPRWRGPSPVRLSSLSHFRRDTPPRSFHEPITITARATFGSGDMHTTR